MFLVIRGGANPLFINDLAHSATSKINQINNFQLKLIKSLNINSIDLYQKSYIHKKNNNLTNSYKEEFTSSNSVFNNIILSSNNINQNRVASSAANGKNVTSKHREEKSSIKSIVLNKVIDSLNLLHNTIVNKYKLFNINLKIKKLMEARVRFYFS